MWLHSKQDEPHHAFRLAEQIMLHLIMNCYNDPLCSNWRPTEKCLVNLSSAAYLKKLLILHL